MKIALTCDWYSPRIGGLEMQMKDLARELAARGHDVDVIASTPGPELVDGIRVHRVAGSRLPKIRMVWTRTTLRHLERLLVDGRYDLVHAHTAFSSLAQMSCYLAKKHGIPSVLTEHSVMKGLGAAILGVADRLTPWTTWPDVLTAVSTYVARELERVSGREALVLPNGVTPDEWELGPAQGDDERVRITSVMRLFKRKRPVDIVRAIPRVHALVPAARRPLFTLVGDGPERKHVEREAQRLGVSEHLELCGWQPRAEVKKVLARSSLFILPTSKEALSIATLEALSAGVPAVAMAHGGVGDIIQNGREGFLARDDAEFIGYIARLCRDGELRRQLQGNARTSAARFSWPAVIDRHLEIYRLAAERAGRGPRVTIPSAAA
jgi:glycosyltransferase involved in cell wall biosynthesis